MAGRRSKTPPNLPDRIEEIRIGPRQVLRTGMEAKVRFPGRRQNVMARFLYADERGFLSFTDPRNGGRRTVSADCVVSIPRNQAPRRDQ